MSKIFVHAKTMIDGVSDTPKFDQLITCEDRKITAIEPYHTINEDVVEANVVTPGFFNCHVHIMEPVGFGTDKEFTFIEKTFYTQKHLEDYINSGVTFIRVVGTENDYDMDIRDCVDAGLVKGPHMLCAGRCICMTGGHGWQGGIEADGVDECRKAATHAQGTQGIKNALYAGIDSIEHGIFLDQECIDYMKEHGTYLVPTLVAPQCIVEKGVEAGIADYMVKKAIYVKDAHVESFKKAYAQGVKIALGTDGGTPFNYHNNTAYEFELMEKYGVDRMDILKIATHNSADCLGVLDDYGTLEVGKNADLVCLKENPLDAISNIRKIDKVIKDGAVVVEK